jgi:hypothetical protein
VWGCGCGCRLRAPHPAHPRAMGSTPWACSRGVGVARELRWGAGALCQGKREERDKEDLYGEEDKNSRVLLHTCMTTEGLWTQVAQHNNFGVLDFDFTSSWT